MAAMFCSPAKVIIENIPRNNLSGNKEEKQMFGLDKMFDLDRNGRLDTLEKAGRAAFLTQMLEEEEKRKKKNRTWDDDDED